ncbi:MAG: hypothetical protein ACI8ZB_001824 [Desulforhopalus sp.]|jgi:hypothetical protein
MFFEKNFVKVLTPASFQFTGVRNLPSKANSVGLTVVTPAPPLFLLY